MKHFSTALQVLTGIFLMPILFSGNLFAQSVGINYTGNAPNPCALLDVEGTTKGLLIPRMGLTQRNAIPSPVKGLLIFQNDNIEGFYYYSGTTWVSLASGGGGSSGLANNVGISGGTTLIGGTGVADPLILRSTSGNGTTGSDIIFQGGSNGATEFMRIKTVSTGSGQSGSSATGGTITTSGAYTIHTFTSSGSSFTPNGNLDVEYLVVAGGGGGGKPSLSGAPGGGGGGAGGLRTGTLSVTATSYAITVGAGGAGATTANTVGANGSNSVFSTITATGGGGGGTAWTDPGSGGSGGGGSYDGSDPGAASPSGQGNAGGGGVSGNFAGAGGGGAGAAGNNPGGSGATGTGGNGGAGSASSISGTSVTYAGGGGGGTYNTSTPGSGGSGIGGNGASNGSNGSNGTANRGGGGGGGGATWISSNNPANSGNGGNGGSGIVIIRYLTPSGGGSTIEGLVGIGTASPSAKLHVKNGHIRSEQEDVPLIAVSTQNGITAATITAGSSDTKGNLTTTGTNNTSGNTQITVTFEVPYTIAPIIVITAANANARDCKYYVTSSITSFTLNFINGGSAPSFNYQIIE